MTSPMRTFATRMPWWLLSLVCLSAAASTLWLGFVVTYFSNLDRGTEERLPIHWSGRDFEVRARNVRQQDQGIIAQLGPDGKAVLEAPAQTVRAADYQFLRLVGHRMPASTTAAFFWQTANNPSPLFLDLEPVTSPIRLRPLPPKGWSGLWLALASFREWEQQVTRIGVAFTGQPGDQIELRELQLLPATVATVTQAAVAGWTNHQSWNQSSINAHPGYAPKPVAAFRTTVTVGLVGLSLIFYLGMVALRRFRIRSDWRVPSSLVLAGWLVLDAPWQWILLRQLYGTYHTYADQPAESKAMRGPDAAIYRLTEKADRLLGSEPARVFVAAGGEYPALRAAYRLYPHNPYWNRFQENELPPARHLKAGDYILSVGSKKTKYAAAAAELHWPPNQRILAERAFIDPAGALYRVLD